MAGQPPLGMLLTPPWTPVNTPLPVEIKATHSTCSSPLIKVWFSSSSVVEALSGVESRVEHSLKLQK
jgi:hypothetical protein